MTRTGSIRQAPERPSSGSGSTSNGRSGPTGRSPESTSRRACPSREAADQQQLQQARAFYADLLIKGVVREYDGGECWYDVHPIMRDIPAFKDALTRG